MVDPRIYRAGWLIVFVALVVFGFSLRNGPVAETTGLAPGANFSSAAGDAATLAADYGATVPGSAGDAAMAARIASELTSAGGFSVSSQSTILETAAGQRPVTTVEAERPGLGAGTVVVLADRDAALPGPVTGSRRPGGSAAQAHASPLAATAASAVLVDLAQALGGAALNRSLLLVSTNSSVGGAGAAALARQLAGSDVDAVIVLGDLSARVVRSPVVEPFADTDALAPPSLVASLDHALGAEAGITVGYPSFGSEIAQLAFPFAAGSQAPFARQGIAAAELSLSGARLASATEPADPARIAGMGLAVEEAVDALDSGTVVGSPSAYLTVAGQVIPLWAFRLLALALILPVALTLVDALARARRRGHSVLSWTVWVLSGTVPFLLAWILLRAAGLTHVVAAPPGAVGQGVPLGVAPIVLMVAAAAVIALAFRLIRPIGVQIASGIGWRRAPSSPAIEGAVVALSIVLCLLALVVWVLNPFAALLLVPALHAWLWLGSPGVIQSRWRAVLLLFVGLVVPLLLGLYELHSLALAPWGLLWSLTMGLAGGAVSVLAALGLCLALGVFAGAVVLLMRASRAAAVQAAAPVTVRGPAGYAGPGSLGGTHSALRR